MSTPLGGGCIIFAFSAVHLPASITVGFRSFQGKVFILFLPNCMGLVLVISRKSVYPIFTKLHGIGFGEDSSIAN